MNEEQAFSCCEIRD